MITVVKVGGSLYDRPDLGPRLRRWLTALHAPRVVMVPGGGATADAVRAWDRVHGLGQERAHWLALRALTLNAHLLANVVPSARLLENGEQPPQDGCWVLDAYAFARADEARPGVLPHTWDVTSDALAARYAVVVGAKRLILLKSVIVPEGMPWDRAGQLGLVDRYFGQVLRDAPLVDVRVVNLRAGTT
jgi:5-(aminomethyl)-3-furanmethanol phosphate kinase